MLLMGKSTINHHFQLVFINYFDWAMASSSLTVEKKTPFMTYTCYMELQGASAGARWEDLTPKTTKFCSFVTVVTAQKNIGNMSSLF